MIENGIKTTFKLLSKELTDVQDKEGQEMLQKEAIVCRFCMHKTMNERTW